MICVKDCEFLHRASPSVSICSMYVATLNQKVDEENYTALRCLECVNKEVEVLREKIQELITMYKGMKPVLVMLERVVEGMNGR